MSNRGPHTTRYKKVLFKNLHCIYCCFCGTCTYRNCSDKHHLATIEHIVPMAHGGEKIDRDNMAISCNVCNEERGLADFIEFKKFKQGFRDTPPIFSHRKLIKRNKKLKEKLFIEQAKYKQKADKKGAKRAVRVFRYFNYDCINNYLIMAEWT